MQLVTLTVVLIDEVCNKGAVVWVDGSSGFLRHMVIFILGIRKRNQHTCGMSHLFSYRPGLADVSLVPLGASERSRLPGEQT
jgi:hypothetical protein